MDAHARHSAELAASPIALRQSVLTQHAAEIADLTSAIKQIDDEIDQCDASLQEDISILQSEFANISMDQVDTSQLSPIPIHSLRKSELEMFKQESLAEKEVLALRELHAQQKLQEAQRKLAEADQLSQQLKQFTESVIHPQPHPHSPDASAQQQTPSNSSSFNRSRINRENIPFFQTWRESDDDDESNQQRITAAPSRTPAKSALKTKGESKPPIASSPKTRVVGSPKTKIPDAITASLDRSGTVVEDDELIDSDSDASPLRGRSTVRPVTTDVALDNIRSLEGKRLQKEQRGEANDLNRGVLQRSSANTSTVIPPSPVILRPSPSMIRSQSLREPKTVSSPALPPKTPARADTSIRTRTPTSLRSAPSPTSGGVTRIVASPDSTIPDAIRATINRSATIFDDDEFLDSDSDVDREIPAFASPKAQSDPKKRTEISRIRKLEVGPLCSIISSY